MHQEQLQNLPRAHNAATLEDLVNPVEEREVGDSPYRFEGGNADIASGKKEVAI